MVFVFNSVVVCFSFFVVLVFVLMFVYRLCWLVVAWLIWCLLRAFVARWVGVVCYFFMLTWLVISCWCNVVLVDLVVAVTRVV